MEGKLSNRSVYPPILSDIVIQEAKETFKITRPVIPNRHRPEEYEDEIKDDQFLV